MDKKHSKAKFKIDSLLNKMSLEEKASLCSGEFWNTKSIEKFGIPSICFSDGPHGLRKVISGTVSISAETEVSTCFPTTSAMGASWNRQLIYNIGRALGKECNSLGVDVLLGPGINMKRTPLCGRNFEYFSEDPYHTAECAISYIRGVQDCGVGTSLKHFVCNNQEYQRFSIDVIVDERTLREIYLRAFEIVIQAADPWTVMSSYNSLNGNLLSENRRLLVDILRNEWGYSGLVVSDWVSIYDRVKALAAGCELEMPQKTGNGDKKIIKAIECGDLDKRHLDDSVSSLLSLLNKLEKNKEKKSTGYDPDTHHQLAYEAACESIVLLKNEENILPISRQRVKKIAVIGNFAVNPRIQGWGSSFVNAYKIDIPFDEIKKRAGGDIEVYFAEGYRDEDNGDSGLIDQAKRTAEKADLVIVFAGTYETADMEGRDREHINLPVSHNLLINHISEVNNNIVVVLCNGSAVRMPWLGRVKAVLETWLSGQASASAAADILFGIVNPSGKLTETFPLRLEDTPAYINYPGDEGKVYYNEGLYIGYRYYDKRKMDVLFPFGFGLSYTTFEYSDLIVNHDKIKTTDKLKIRVKIKNTGMVPGKDVVQLYVRDVESTISMPEKELKGFEKIELEPGEEKVVHFELQKNAFSYYDVDMGTWCVESGDFEILVGTSSGDIKLKKRIFVASKDKKLKKFTPHSYLIDFYNNPVAKKILQNWFIDRTNGRINFDSPEGIINAPLSKFIIFMAENIMEEDMVGIVERINAELGL